MKCWYSKIGPLSWYHREWVRLEMMLGNRLLFSVKYSRQSRQFILHVGGRVNRRSQFGSPVDLSPRWSFYYPDSLGA